MREGVLFNALDGRAPEAASAADARATAPKTNVTVAPVASEYALLL